MADAKEKEKEKDKDRSLAAGLSQRMDSLFGKGTAKLQRRGAVRAAKVCARTAMARSGKLCTASNL